MPDQNAVAHRVITPSSWGRLKNFADAPKTKDTHLICGANRFRPSPFLCEAMSLMSHDPRHPPSNGQPASGARPGLRLVRDPEVAPAVEVVATPSTEVKAVRRSPFLDFMNAYADAVDQQVKVLLDL